MAEKCGISVKIPPSLYTVQVGAFVYIENAGSAWPRRSRPNLATHIFIRISYNCRNGTK